MAVPPIYVDKALLVTMRFLRTSLGNCRICSDWKCNGLLPLVVLAISRPEKALQWLLSQLPRYSFCGICGNELEGLALVARGQKSPFPLWPTLHNPFCYHIYWCDDTQKRQLVSFCSSLYNLMLLLRSGLYSGMCTGTCKTDASPSSPSLGNILESYSVTLWVAPEKRANQRFWW